MAFAQLTWRESLRDIETCLEAQAGKLYHLAPPLTALMSSLERSIPGSESRASARSPAQYLETSRSCSPRNVPLRSALDPTLS